MQLFVTIKAAEPNDKSTKSKIMGEAIKNVPDDIKLRYPEVGWKAVAGMRDKLIHHYFGVDYELVWDVIENEIDELLFQVKQIIEEEDQKF